MHEPSFSRWISMPPHARDLGRLAEFPSQLGHVHVVGAGVVGQLPRGRLGQHRLVGIGPHLVDHHVFPVTAGLQCHHGLDQLAHRLRQPVPLADHEHEFRVQLVILHVRLPLSVAARLAAQSAFLTRPEPGAAAARAGSRRMRSLLSVTCSHSCPALSFYSAVSCADVSR